MRVLYYTNDKILESEVEEILIESGAEVDRIFSRPTLEVLQRGQYDFIVSDRSRFIIPENVISALEGRIINLHPSFLPFNRGDQPLLWAAVEGTPFGVTIHQVNSKFDEGPIICQTKFSLVEEMTLREAYSVVRKYMVSLFNMSWSSGEITKVVKSPSSMVRNEKKNGSSRSRYQGRIAVSLLPQGWETTLLWLKQNRDRFLAIEDKT